MEVAPSEGACFVTPLFKIVEMYSLGGISNSAVIYFIFSSENSSRKTFPPHCSFFGTRSEIGRSVIIVFHALGGNEMIATPVLIIALLPISDLVAKNERCGGR